MACLVFLTISTSYANDINLNNENDLEIQKSNEGVTEIDESNYSLNEEDSQSTIVSTLSDSKNSSNSSTLSNSSSSSTNSSVASSELVKNSTTGQSSIKAAGENTKPSSLTQASILNAAKTVNSYISKNKKLPNYVTINNYKYSMPEFLYLLSRTVYLKYNGKTSKVDVKYGINNPTKASGKTIKGKITKKYYYKYSKNIIKFIKKYNKAPNYINTKLGKMQYQTTIYAYVKLLTWSKNNNGKLPSSVSVSVKSSHKMNKNLPKYSSSSSSSSTSSSSSSSSSSSTKLSQSAIWTASKTIKAYVEKYGYLPDSVTVSGKTLSMPQYMYVASKAIAYKYKGKSNSIAILSNIKVPNSPFGDTINKKIPKAKYFDIAKRTFTYITNNRQAPNYVSSDYGKIQYQTAIYGFSLIGAYISNNGKIPSSVTLKVAKTSTLNKNMPSSVSSTPIKVLSGNKNAIWVHSGDMNAVDLNLLASYGIGNIFIHEDIFTNKNAALEWIKQANSNNIKVHIWFTCFYDTTNKKWINPVDTSTGKINQAYFTQIINRAKTYASYEGVGGIHLDYLRYPGTAYKTDGGTKAITEFVRQLSVAVKAINSNIVLSAAVMPETSVNAYYYGQDCAQLGQYLDVITPMIYEGNYNQNNAWIKSTTAWFVKNSGGAEIWGGLQGYYSDSNVVNLPVANLKADVISVLEGGAAGVAIFRWGRATLFSLLNL